MSQSVWRNAILEKMATRSAGLTTDPRVVRRLSMQQLTQTPRGRAAQILILTVLVGVTLATGACARKGGYPGGGPGGGGGFAFPVAAAPLKRGDISQYASTTGAVVPKLTGDLSSVASGTVLSVGAQIGQHVTKGQLLVQIDDSTLRAQEAQAAANYDQLRANAVGGNSTADANLRSAQVANNNAQLTLHRNQTLYSQGYVSKSALDDATNAAAAAQAQLRQAQVAAQNASLSTQNSAAVAQLNSAQAALSTVQRQIAQAHVTAPFDGVVTARNVDPGSLAAPGTVLMSVSQLDPVFID